MIYVLCAVSSLAHAVGKMKDGYSKCMKAEESTYYLISL